VETGVHVWDVSADFGERGRRVLGLLGGEEKRWMCMCELLVYLSVEAGRLGRTWRTQHMADDSTHTGGAIVFLGKAVDLALLLHARTRYSTALEATGLF
jgi:hypothetical protein